MKIPTNSSLFIFVLFFVCGVAPPREETADELEHLAANKLVEGKKTLTTFDYLFNRALERPYPRKAFGGLFRESIAFDGKYNEKKVDSEIVEEFKKILIYFYATTLRTVDPIETLADYHVTHIATWFNLNFQTCSSYYGDDEQYKTISESCKRLSEFLDIFASVLSPIKARRFAEFKKGSQKHIKAIELTNLRENEAEIISERLKTFKKIKKVIELEKKFCEEIIDANEKKYCEIWIPKLIEQTTDFKLDNIFFDVYNGLLVDENYFNKFRYDSYRSDYTKSVELWEYAPQLLEKVKAQQSKNKNEKRKITSFAVDALMEIMDFKLSQSGVDIGLVQDLMPSLEKIDYASSSFKEYFKGDEAETDDAT